MNDRLLLAESQYDVARQFSARDIVPAEEARWEEAKSAHDKAAAELKNLKVQYYELLENMSAGVVEGDIADKLGQGSGSGGGETLGKIAEALGEISEAVPDCPLPDLGQ